MGNDNDPVTVGTLTLTLEKFFVEKFSFLENIVEENKKMKEKVEELNLRVVELETHLDEQAAYSRRNNVVIHGIPIKENEKEMEVAKMIGELVGVSLKEEDIDAAHRLRSTQKNKNAPPFIIKLVSRFKRAELIKKAKEIKPTAERCGGDPRNKIFYADHLTKKNQEILYQAKKLWEKYYVWTKNGNVLCREKNTEGALVKRIKSVQEVGELWNCIPDSRDKGSKRNVEETSPDVRSNTIKKTNVSGKHGLEKFQYRNNR